MIIVKSPHFKIEIVVGRFIKGAWVERKGQFEPYYKPIVINESKKYDYIFSDSVWMGTHYVSKYEALIEIPLFEIQKLIKFEEYLTSTNNPDINERFKHKGLFSLPIFIYSSLSLVSDFFTGHTKKKSNPRNIELFINQYFPIGFLNIQILMWGGMRDGITHQIYPNTYRYNLKNMIYNSTKDNYRDIILNLSSYDEKMPSMISTYNGNPVISINWIEYAYEYMKAVNSYKSDLETDPLLQRNFINAYKSFNDKIIVNDKDKKAYEIRNVIISLMEHYSKNKSPLIIKDWN